MDRFDNLAQANLGGVSQRQRKEHTPLYLYTIHSYNKQMAKNTSYTDQEFIQAVAESTSIRQVLIKLGLKPVGGNYAVAKIRIAKLGLDTNHHTGQSWVKGKNVTLRKPKPLDEILVENSNYQSYKLKNRLYEAGLAKPQCYECGLVEWNGKKLSFHLDHINGISNDHRLENLQILCPNCHSQTDTYCGKNKKM